MSSLEENIAKVTAFYAAQAAHYHEVTYENHSDEKFASLKARYHELFKGHTVLEIASGTGYWTEVVASTARKVVTTDANPNLVEISRQRLVSFDNVHCQVADAYSLDTVEGSFSAAFAQYWLSHVPKKRIKTFLATLHSKLQPGAPVFFSDDLIYYRDTLTRRVDEHGDIYEGRPRRDGSRSETIKNFPTEQELVELLTDVADDITYQELEPAHLWTLSYRLKR